jgi:hypothetical protein
MFKGLHKYEIRRATIFAWLLLCFVAPGPVFGQPHIAIGEQARCVNSEVYIPVHALEYFDITALTLFIAIDTLKLEYLSVDNLHPQIEEGSFVSNYNEINGQIAISWFRLTPANIEDEKLFDIIMHYKNGEADIVFMENYEIVYADNSIADDAVLTDGLVIPIDIHIISHPESLDVTEGEQAVFETELADHNGLHFRWQKHNGAYWENLHDTIKYTGADTDHLTINYASTDLDNTSWRCKVYLDDCIEFSDPAILTVIVPTDTGRLDQTGELLKVFPNPCSHTLHVEVNKALDQFVLQLLNVHGEIIYTDQKPRHAFTIDVKLLLPGVYFLQVNTRESIRKTIRVIII